MMRKDMFKKVIIVSCFAIWSEVYGMTETGYNSLQDSGVGYKNRCFPLSAEVLGRHNPVLWKTITKLSKTLTIKRGKEYYILLVDAARGIQSLDICFATLIEVGNLAVINGSEEAFCKANDCLAKIINKMSADDALIGLRNQMISYCFMEDGKYIPDHMACWNNRGALTMLIKLASSIKGGSTLQRKETASVCRALLSELEEFGKK